ncbi:hypothetical protein AB0L82_06645 [Nocardia sp. NPDC052001]|uniref:hypothetical protein n=1 Tax=unclassified Nocardia TaxID=2637762 RepID=UPI003426D5E6
MLRDLLNYRISLRQIMYLAIAFGVPYLAIGLVWLGLHHDHLNELHGLDLVFSAIGEVIAWPPLLISNIELR